MPGPKGPFCRSCGMPLSRDPLGGGTEAGRFTEPDISVEQMVAKVEGKLREMHFPGFLARRFTKNIPMLRRWQSTTASRAT